MRSAIAAGPTTTTTTTSATSGGNSSIITGVSPPYYHGSNGIVLRGEVIPGYSYGTTSSSSSSSNTNNTNSGGGGLFSNRRRGDKSNNNKAGRSTSMGFNAPSGGGGGGGTSTAAVSMRPANVSNNYGNDASGNMKNGMQQQQRHRRHFTMNMTSNPSPSSFDHNNYMMSLDNTSSSAGQGNNPLMKGNRRPRSSSVPKNQGRSTIPYHYGSPPSSTLTNADPNSIMLSTSASSALSAEQRIKILSKVAERRQQVHDHVMSCSTDEWKEIQASLRKTKARTNAGVAMAMDCHLLDTSIMKKSSQTQAASSSLKRNESENSNKSNNSSSNKNNAGEGGTSSSKQPQSQELLQDEKVEIENQKQVLANASVDTTLERTNGKKSLDEREHHTSSMEQESSLGQTTSSLGAENSSKSVTAAAVAGEKNEPVVVTTTSADTSRGDKMMFGRSFSVSQRGLVGGLNSSRRGSFTHAMQAIRSTSQRFEVVSKSLLNDLRSYAIQQEKEEEEAELLDGTNNKKNKNMAINLLQRFTMRHRRSNDGDANGVKPHSSSSVVAPPSGTVGSKISRRRSMTSPTTAGTANNSAPDVSTTATAYNSTSSSNTLGTTTTGSNNTMHQQKNSSWRTLSTVDASASPTSFQRQPIALSIPNSFEDEDYSGSNNSNSNHGRSRSGGGGRRGFPFLRRKASRGTINNNSDDIVGGSLRSLTRNTIITNDPIDEETTSAAVPTTTKNNNNEEEATKQQNRNFGIGGIRQRLGGGGGGSRRARRAQTMSHVVSSTYESAESSQPKDITTAHMEGSTTAMEDCKQEDTLPPGVSNMEKQ